MARIKTGPIVADIAGKVGDNVFSKNAYGPYVRAWASPVIPVTAHVTAARANMTAASAAWSALSDSQRLNYASFAVNYPISRFCDGYQRLDPRSFFVGNYINQVNAGLAPDPQISNPPAFDFQSLNIDLVDCDTFNFKCNGGENTSDFRAIYYSHPGVSLDVLSLNTVPQYIFAAANYAADSWVNLAAEWKTRWPGQIPPTTERLFGSVKIIHSASGIQVGFAWNKTIGTSNFSEVEYGYSFPFTNTVTGTSQIATLITIPVAGNLISITFDLVFIEQSIQYALYDDAGGKPGNLIGLTPIVEELPLPAIANTISFDSPIPLSAGDYWIASGGSATNSIYQRSGSGKRSIGKDKFLAWVSPWRQNSLLTLQPLGRLSLSVPSGPCP